jgi:hypothetical protein
MTTEAHTEPEGDASSISSSSNNTTSSSTANTTTASTKRRRGITFHDQVTVVPIPKRDEYSRRIRDRIWVNARDLQTQVARNTLEFASEGWEWKNCFEDDEMYVCAESGEKVHPVHCELDD